MFFMKSLHLWCRLQVEDLTHPRNLQIITSNFEMSNLITKPFACWWLFLQTLSSRLCLWWSEASQSWWAYCQSQRCRNQPPKRHWSHQHCQWSTNHKATTPWWQRHLWGCGFRKWYQETFLGWTGELQCMFSGNTAVISNEGEPREVPCMYNKANVLYN